MFRSKEAALDAQLMHGRVHSEGEEGRFHLGQTIFRTGKQGGGRLLKIKDGFQIYSWPEPRVV